jgi:putative sterol carrier protein
VVADGRIELGLGDIENPDATITQSYETAVALAKREANPVTSFMMGKIKIDGNMGMLMGLAGALGKLADGMSTLDVEY